MSNQIRYIRDLEAVGFERKQAEAQVQILLDALEGDLVTKSDFAIFQERHENKLAQYQQSIENKFSQHRQEVATLIKDSEYRTVTRLGMLTISTVSIAVAVLTWLIKI